MTPNEAAALLDQHNRWRRGDESVQPTDPVMLGVAIDTALAALAQRDDLLVLAAQSYDKLAAWAKAYRESRSVVEWSPPAGNARLCEKLSMAVAMSKGAVA